MTRERKSRTGRKRSSNLLFLLLLSLRLPFLPPLQPIHSQPPSLTPHLHTPTPLPSSHSLPNHILEPLVLLPTERPSEQISKPDEQLSSWNFWVEGFESSEEIGRLGLGGEIEGDERSSKERGEVGDGGGLSCSGFSNEEDGLEVGGSDGDLLKEEERRSGESEGSFGGGVVVGWGERKEGGEA